ncbi:MAG: hypothetical protein ACK410_02640 [Acinetobacter sp.]
MDTEARNKMFKLTRNEIKQIGVSNGLIGWNDFLNFATQVVNDYNNKPHSSLKRISTNLEMLNEKALEAGTPHITKQVLKELLLDGFVTGESPKPRSF